MTRNWGFSCGSKRANGFVTLIFLFVCGDFALNAVQCNFTTNRYERTANNFLQNTFSTFKAASRVECCAFCDQNIGCNSVNFNNNSKECQLSIESKIAISVNSQENINWNIYSKNGMKINVYFKLLI